MEKSNDNSHIMIRLVIYAILIMGFFIWFRRKNKDNSKWGINLKRVYCPVCQTKQPIMRMPNSREEALWGGTTCPKCHTKLDKYGNIIT
jgi:ssDNA-binding Zn-finger/Zn-ribbon topoisomerase 1